MTDLTSLYNLALQSFGSRTTVTAAEIANEDTNEAIQLNLAYANCRDSLLRMAPWDCALTPVNLTYITSVPGTPENTSPATALWEKGQPSPPFAYEYQYPVDCLRACWIIPAFQTGFADGVPITTAVTGGASNFWAGGPIVFKVQVDQFLAVTAGAVVAGGTGYVVGDEITLTGTTAGDPPIGAPVTLVVATLSGSAVATVTVKNQVAGSSTPLGGSYFEVQSGTIEQDTTTGSGTGATFTITQQSTKSDQRVILTNQEFATLAYVKQVTDPNVWDSLFQSALYNLMGASVCMALTGDKKLANMCIAETNAAIAEARKADGNEGLTINDVTPEWIRTRGFPGSGGFSGPFNPGLGFDWGGFWQMY
jgi:hypothetical protein